MNPVRAAQLSGRPADVLRACEAALASADPAVITEAQAARAQALAQLGRAAEAFAGLDAACREQRAAGRPGEAAKLSVAESALKMASGDLPAAMSALVQAANDFGAAGDIASQIRAQTQLACAYAMASRPAAARQILDGCLSAAQRLGDGEVLAEVRHQEGALLAASDADPSASFEDGVAAADRSGSPAARVRLRVDLACALAPSDISRPVSLLAEAEAVAAGATDPAEAAAGLMAVAQGWWAMRRADDGLRCASRALGLAQAAGAWPLAVGAAVAAADVCAATGRPAQAQRFTSSALDAGGRVGGPAGEAEVMVMLGQASLTRGDRIAARGAFADAARRLRAAGLAVPPQLLAALGD